MSLLLADLNKKISQRIKGAMPFTSKATKVKPSIMDENRIRPKPFFTT